MSKWIKCEDELPLDEQLKEALKVANKWDNYERGVKMSYKKPA